MSRLPIVAASLAVSGLVLIAQQPTPFRPTANLVVVPAVVVDKKGAIVSGLGVDAFTVFADGRPVPMETFIPPRMRAKVSVAGSYYLLGYRAPVDNRRVHKIDVKVDIPGVVVRARRARG